LVSTYPIATAGAIRWFRDTKGWFCANRRTASTITGVLLVKIEPNVWLKWKLASLRGYGDLAGDDLIGPTQFNLDNGCLCLMRVKDGELPPAKAGGIRLHREQPLFPTDLHLLSTGVNSGRSNPIDSFIFEIHGRIQVTVMLRAAVRTVPNTDRKRQFRQYLAVNRTHAAGWIKTIDDYHLRTVPDTLVD
jgi:hypothetical protein